MDGDRGPVGELGGLARAHDAWLMTDDAHGWGSARREPADVQMGTLSKAVGSCGGYVCGSSELIAWLANRARSLMFSTGLPPASVAAAAAALRIIRDDEELRAKPLENARRFTDALGRPPADSPIVPVIVGEPERALAASAMLQRAWPAGRRDPPAVASRPARHGSGSPSRRCTSPSRSSGRGSLKKHRICLSRSA